MEKIIGTGAEAILIHKNNSLIKRRIKKSYRLKEIDDKLRKTRTKAEGKILDKLKNIINVPEIIKIDKDNKEIIMQFIQGKKLSEYLDSFPLKQQEQICKEVGKGIGEIHNENIIHGDLTTSNMILSQNKIFFIDFGLGFHSRRIEDKAVDLHLMKQALESKHFKNWQKLFNSVLQGYKTQDKDKILNQFKKVESRGRYKSQACI